LRCKDAGSLDSSAIEAAEDAVSAADQRGLATQRYFVNADYY